MGQHVHWHHTCAALALCMLLVCTGCSGQEAASGTQDASADQPVADAMASKGKTTPVAKPRGKAPGGRAAGKAAAAAKAAPRSPANTGKTASNAASGKAVKAPAKAPAKRSGKSAARPQKGAVASGLRGKDLDAAVLKVMQLCDSLCGNLLQLIPCPRGLLYVNISQHPTVISTSAMPHCCHHRLWMR
jgi:hypothetical protein